MMDIGLIACEKVWHVYLVRCADSSLYTGIALDVPRRLAEHQSGGKRASRYLRGRGPLTLAMARPVGGRGQAQRVEYRIKRLARGQKERLIDGDEALFRLLLR